MCLVKAWDADLGVIWWIVRYFDFFGREGIEMEGCAKASNGVERPLISSAGNALSSAEDLQSMVHKLRERLSPVLRPENPSEGSPKQEEDSVPLLEMLRHALFIQQTTMLMLDDLVDRLSV